MEKVVSIGNFDAVHIGHSALVKKARELAGVNGTVEIFTFDPPPVSILRPDVQVGRLTSICSREALLLEAGADEVHVVEPTKELLAMEPENFLEELCSTYNPTIFLEGEGFLFGRDRKGTIETLRRKGEELGFTCEEFAGVEMTYSSGESIRVSSSKIRSLLENGSIEDATALLGRPFTVSGVVVEGDKRGRVLGFPTANLGSIETMLPANGIYAGSAVIEGDSYVCAISIGTKPTFGSHDCVCEVHVIGFDGEIGHYNWPLTVTISSWLREQTTFSTVEELTIAIKSDVEKAISLTESNL